MRVEGKRSSDFVILPNGAKVRSDGAPPVIEEMFPCVRGVAFANRLCVADRDGVTNTRFCCQAKMTL